MKDTAQQWLTNRASPPGMLACGLRTPDGKFIGHSIEDSCSTKTLESILGRFDSLRKEVYSDQLTPRWSTWSFERGQIRFVARPDGWVLAMVARDASDAQPWLDPLSTEFLSLELEG
jgi:hypothetical protein